jgi:hypothetical protein
LLHWLLLLCDDEGRPLQRRQQQRCTYGSDGEEQRTPPTDPLTTHRGTRRKKDEQRERERERKRERERMRVAASSLAHRQ